MLRRAVARVAGVGRLRRVVVRVVGRLRRLAAGWRTGVVRAAGADVGRLQQTVVG